jgi:hypothetical protein
VDQAFQALKQSLISVLLLKLLDFDKKFMVECDMSGSMFDAVLHHGDGPIAFFSHTIATHHAKLPAYK